MWMGQKQRESKWGEAESQPIAYSIQEYKKDPEEWHL